MRRARNSSISLGMPAWGIPIDLGCPPHRLGKARSGRPIFLLLCALRRGVSSTHSSIHMNHYSFGKVPGSPKTRRPVDCRTVALTACQPHRPPFNALGYQLLFRCLHPDTRRPGTPPGRIPPNACACCLPLAFVCVCQSISILAMTAIHSAIRNYQ